MESLCYNQGHMDNKPNKSIWKKWWFWVILVLGVPFVFLLIMGTIGNSLPESATTTPSEAPQAVVTEAIATQVPMQYVFDIPSLIGKDIIGVKAALGTPKDKEPTSQQIKLGAKEWSLTFEKEGKELLVTYKTATGKIVDYFIGTDDPSGKTKDKGHLLEIGNINEGDSRYKIEFVKALNDSSVFTGVKVTPL